LQHRQYVRGDDLRRLDWKIWGKQDRLVIKQYEEDTNLRCTMLVDVSASMQYGNGPLNKYEYASTVASSLAYLLLRQQDAVGCVPFDESARTKVPLRSKRTHLHSIIDALNVSTPRDKTEMYGILKEVAETYPRRGMMVVISDLLAEKHGSIDRSGMMKGLRMLRQRGHDVLVLHVMDDDELDFPFTGPTRFDGLELDEFLNCNPRALREGYLQALNTFLEEIRRACAKETIDYKLIRTSDPLDAALATFLSNRLGMHHKN
jgi:uncharacterized protein (DUF58 family)